jgi:hypothetical protein
MSRDSTEERFREAAEAEGGMPVSAGARILHVRSATEAGRVFYVDLSDLPEEDRPAVVAAIKQLVDRAVAQASAKSPNPARKSSQS